MVPLLHTAPLLSPALLTLSIRLHISLYLSLPTISHLLQPPHQAGRLGNALADVLEKAALINEGQGGTSRGWKSVILSIMVCLESKQSSVCSDLVIAQCEQRLIDQEPRGDSFSLLLHPSLPPLHRPQPPLSQLHFFSTETEEEKRLRLEMGFATELDLENEAGDERQDEDHDVEMTGSMDSKKVAKRSDMASLPRGQRTIRTGPSTTTRSPPQSSDLQIPTSASEKLIPHSTHTKADSTVVDTIPQSEALPQGSDDLTAPDSLLLNHEGSRDQQEAQDKINKEPEEHSEVSQSGEAKLAGQSKASTAVVHEKLKMEVGGEEGEEEEPMPELDSDMDLSDEEGEGEEEEDDEE